MARRYRTSPTKVGSNIRTLVDQYAPPIALLVKLGSIAVHADEFFSEDGHDFDRQTILSLLADREVQDWLASMDASGFLPKKRNPAQS